MLVKYRKQNINEIKNLTMLSWFVTGYLASIFSGNKYLLRIYFVTLRRILEILPFGGVIFSSVLYARIPLLVRKNKTKGNNIWRTLE